MEHFKDTPLKKYLAQYLGFYPTTSPHYPYTPTTLTPLDPYPLTLPPWIDLLIQKK